MKRAVVALVGAFLALVTPSVAQITAEIPLIEVELNPPPVLPESLDPVDVRHRLYSELDQMDGVQLLRFHEGLSFGGYRDYEEVAEVLSDPPVLSTVRVELDTFIATREDNHEILQVYAFLRGMRDHDHKMFRKTLEKLNGNTEVESVSSAHEDGDGTSWTDRECVEAAQNDPSSNLSQDHMAAIWASARMFRDLCLRSQHTYNCTEHMHRWYDACEGDYTQEPYEGLDAHCLGHTTQMQQCWARNGWRGC